MMRFTGNPENGWLVRLMMDPFKRCSICMMSDECFSSTSLDSQLGAGILIDDICLGHFLILELIFLSIVLEWPIKLFYFKWFRNSFDRNMRNNCPKKRTEQMKRKKSLAQAPQVREAKRAKQTISSKKCVIRWLLLLLRLLYVSFAFTHGAFSANDVDWISNYALVSHE